MYKLWPSTGLFLFAAWLILTGWYESEKQRQFLAEHSPGGRIGDPHWVGSSDREKAKFELEFARYKQIGGGVLAAVGFALGALGMLHHHVQTEALNRRLTVTYTFVPVVPRDGNLPDTELLTENQATEVLHKRNPSLAADATKKLRAEFAEKRRLEPTKLWFVKDVQVSEITA